MPVAILNDTTVNEERAIAVLREGTPLSTLRALATQWQMADAELDALLRRLDPALEHDSSSTTRGRIWVEGDAPGTVEISNVLKDDWTVSDTNPDLVVIAANYVMPLHAAGKWLRRDVPHLLVTFDEQGASVGPLVIPGITPCAFCVDDAHRARDDSWPAIVTQLMFIPAPRPATHLRFRVATEVARMAHRWGRAEELHGERVHLDGDFAAEVGEQLRNSVGRFDRIEFSDECRCRSL